MPSPLHLPSSACLALHTHLALLRPSHPGPSARCWLDPTASPPSWAQPPSPAARGGTKWRPLGPAALLHREQPAARGQHQQSTWNVLRHKSVSTSGAAHLPHTWNNNTQLKKTLVLLAGFVAADCWGPCGYLFPFPDRKPKEKHEKTTPLFIFIRVSKQ